MTALVTERPKAVSAPPVTDHERLELFLKERNIAPLNEAKVDTHMDCVLQREKQAAKMAVRITPAVIALSVIAAVVAVITISWWWTAVSIGGFSMAALFFFAGKAALEEGLYIMNDSYERYREQWWLRGPTPFRIRRLVKQLQGANPRLRFIVHYTQVDPILEVHYGEAKAKIDSWRHPGWWARSVDLT